MRLYGKADASTRFGPNAVQAHVACFNLVPAYCLPGPLSAGPRSIGIDMGAFKPLG